MGIFTERDYARKIALLGRTSAATQVRDVMTPMCFTCACTRPVSSACSS